MKRLRNKPDIQESRIETFHYEPTRPAAQKTGIKRVAAYCRVSTLTEEQQLSFETQRNYYRDLVEKNPDMVLVGIYADQGFSGLRAAGRKEFQRLIADCEADKIDMVLVKSISRFSRNTVECREFLQRLKEHGVAVLFEKEGLNSMDPKTDMILSIYASVAQNESCSNSENIRWARRRRAELGDPARCACYGYRIRKKPGDTYRYWEIKEEEAVRIRYIFSLAYQGYSLKEIHEHLTRRDTLEGNAPWSFERMRLTLLNEAYRGDILTNKTVMLDYVSGKSIKNMGQAEQFYLEQHHEPIVDPEVFDAVQGYFRAGYLNARNKHLRMKWMNEHPEILKRRNKAKEETK